MVTDGEGVPDDRSGEEFDGLGLPPPRSDPRSEAVLEGAEHALDDRPTSVAARELTAVVELVEDHRAPGSHAPRLHPGDVRAERDHRSASAFGDHPRVLSGDVSSVEDDIPEGAMRRDLGQKGRELRHVVGAAVGGMGGEEVGELGPRNHEGVELEEPAVVARASTRVPPLLPPMEREPGAIPRQIPATLGRDPPGETPEEASEVVRRHPGRPGRDRRSGRDPSEPELSSEGGESREDRVDFVIRPRTEGPQEEESNDVPRGGRRPSRGPGRSDGVGRRGGTDEPSEEGQGIDPTVAQEVSVAGPIESTRSAERWVFGTVRR